MVAICNGRQSRIDGLRALATQATFFARNIPCNTEGRWRAAAGDSDRNGVDKGTGMLLSTHQYTQATGWDKPLDAAMDSDTTWLILFGASDTTSLGAGFADLRATFVRAVWIGCSSAGEIHGHSLEDDSLVVAVMQFADTRLRLATSAVQASDTSFATGAALGRELAAPDLKGVFVVSDGLAVNGSDLVRGLSENLAAGVIVTGGLAGDGDRFQNTWVLIDKEPTARYVTAVGLYGSRVRLAHGSKGGWDVLGPEREVTLSHGNVLYSLDGQPALALYKKYLGDRAGGLPATGLLFPLAIRNDLAEDGHTVRTILAVNEADNSITFAGDIPQGSFVRLMRANFDRLIDGAADAASSVDMNGYTDGLPVLGIGISCVGRRLVLGQRTEEEIDAVLDGLPPGCKFIGYYSYGELSPLASGRCDLHNQTMTLSLFWET